MVASSANVRGLRGELEKSGAGGSGRRGLPPYWDEGVPGLGLPLRSEGSYATDGGGRPYSDSRDDGVHGLPGELPSRPANGTYVESGGGMFGASSMKDPVLECADMTLGW